VRPEGFEPPASWFVARRSIQLSYGRKDIIDKASLETGLSAHPTKRNSRRGKNPTLSLYVAEREGFEPSKGF
jgi:hypothetical protein